MFSFIEIRIVDILDIVISAYLMYAVYRLIKGTMAASIVMSIIAFLVFWVVVRALGMSMLCRYGQLCQYRTPCANRHFPARDTNVPNYSEH